MRFALARGATQVVLLGAGLDSFALRNPEIVELVRFVEVDHPDSQRAKRAKLAELGLETPCVEYLPIDFATQNLTLEMERVGIERDRATFFSWLGVTQYITNEAVDDALSLAAHHAMGSEIVFDVIRPLAGLDTAESAISAAAEAMSADFDEPWQTFFNPEELEPHLHALGFSQVDCLTKQKAARYYAGQPVEPLHAWQMMAAVV